MLVQRARWLVGYPYVTCRTIREDSERSDTQQINHRARGMLEVRMPQCEYYGCDGNHERENDQVPIDLL